MYLRTVHAEAAIPLLQQFIRDNPLGILTTAIKSPTYPTIQSSHIPFILDTDDTTGNGRLRAHIAKANPQAKAMIEAIEAQKASGSSTGFQLEDEVLILFNGQHHHYVTPKFYTETKPSTGKVVPTWNYAAVQAYGKATVYYSPANAETGAFLDKQVRELSQNSETGIMGYTGERGKPAPWGVDDAPTSYTDLLKKAIIGIEIQIDRLEGKFKMSQEMGAGDREGVIRGFEALESDVGKGVAQLVKERGEIKDAQAKKAASS